MNPIVTIHQAKSTDINDLVNLLKELCKVEEDFIFNERKQSKGLSLLLISEKNCIFLAKHNTEIVGMCTVQTLISTAEGGSVGIIEDVVVHHDFVCKGVGRKLLSAVAEWSRAQKITRLQLLADRNNQHALAFYEKLGWQKTQLIGLRKLI